MEAGLTQGRWQDNQWGEPPVEVMPPGAVLKLTQFADHGKHTGNEEERKKRHTAVWDQTSEQLGGLLCASLNQMKSFTEMGVGSQHYAMARDGPHKETALPVITHFATLPSEATCTENLAPWATLLPCRMRAGLASYITPHDVAAAPFKTISITAFVSHPSLRDAYTSLSLQSPPNHSQLRWERLHFEAHLHLVTSLKPLPARLLNPPVKAPPHFHLPRLLSMLFTEPSSSETDFVTSSQSDQVSVCAALRRMRVVIRLRCSLSEDPNCSKERLSPLWQRHAVRFDDTTLILTLDGKSNFTVSRDSPHLLSHQLRPPHTPPADSPTQSHEVYWRLWREALERPARQLVWGRSKEVSDLSPSKGVSELCP
eukprot:GHVN01067789.1.p2 GENE.GHVN01067789.1~~GHVN01067789.1.p2  ORF type:complete len:399 (-),score=90.76 GHVN01067789.1:1600-2706(-)